MKASLLAKLDQLVERHEEVGHLLGSADVIADQDRFRALSREYAELEAIAVTYQRYRKVVADSAASAELLRDAGHDVTLLRVGGNAIIDRLAREMKMPKYAKTKMVT